MNALWGYFWPCFAVGLLVGAIIGRVTFRRRTGRESRFAIGVAISVALAAIWHGPLGGASRFEANVDRQVHQLLVDYEMTRVTAHLHQHPLTRRVMLSGPADDFQRQGLVEYMNEIHGVDSASWSTGGGLPLIVEGLIVALLGFLLGLLLAYLAELRRRHNAQWNW